MEVSIEQSWKQLLQPEFDKEYFEGIVNFLKQEKTNLQLIYPPGGLLFNAFEKTPFKKLKVVILGQDPYHGPGQAHGLCFSVPKGIATPPSLQNIFKEIKTDLGYSIPSHGNLEHWAAQGVFLLNAMLSVRANVAASHSKIGWENFTDAVIKTISDKKENVVFLLWGRFAQNKAALIDESKHLILRAAHPSPLSAYNGFFGCRHFSKTNTWLKEKGVGEIDWTV
jgi:uracil-DNA glycosylase